MAVVRISILLSGLVDRHSIFVCHTYRLARPIVPMRRLMNLRARLSWLVRTRVQMSRETGRLCDTSPRSTCQAGRAMLPHVIDHSAMSLSMPLNKHVGNRR